MENLCEVCGHKIMVPSFSNRPKQYCSPECRNYNKYKNALEKILITLRPTKEAKKLLKGDLFGLSNIVPNGTTAAKIKND